MVASVVGPHLGTSAGHRATRHRLAYDAGVSIDGRVRRAIGWLAAAATLAGCAARETPALDPDSVPEAFARSTAALMWPGATRAYQVTPAGDLYNGEWRVVVRAAANGVEADSPRVVAFRERWRPGARWTRRSGDVRWDFDALALPESAPRDSGLLVSLVAHATNTGSSPAEATLELALAPPEADPIFVAFDAPERPAPARWGRGGSGDTVNAWSDVTAEGERLAVRWPLAPGGSRELRVLLPAYPTAAGVLARAARRPHRAWVEESDRFWDRELATGARFELGDPELQDALRAARVLLLSCRERRGTRWVPIGGPFQYRDVWLRDGARAAAALAIAGHTTIARELAGGLAEFQWPNGAFISQRGQLDGNGQALWAFEQTLLRPVADDSVARFADAASRSWAWVEWQRGFGRLSGWPFGVMMPYGDPRDGELVRAQLVGNDAWALAGYRAAERLLRAAGRASQADSVAAARAIYAADFASLLGRTGSRDVPPSWQNVGRDWGNLAVGWPCAALPPDHPRLHRLADRVWAEAGGAGLVTYGHRDSVHDYVGADLAVWGWLAGRRAEADSVLAATLHWRNGSGAGCELFSRSARDFGRNLPPHPTTAAAIIAMVRHALIYDDDDTLRLTIGARDAWWRGAALRQAPTRWGTLDLELRQEGDAAHWTWSPVPVWTELTLPAGRAWVAPLPAPLLPGRRPDRVLAPPGTRDARVALR